MLWQVTLKSEDYGKHLLGVQDLIQKHTLSETDITTQTEWAKALKAQAQKFVEEKHPDSAKITRKANELDAACERLHTHSKHRLSMLQVGNLPHLYWKLIITDRACYRPIYFLFFPPELIVCFCYRNLCVFKSSIFKLKRRRLGLERKSL